MCFIEASAAVPQALLILEAGSVQRTVAAEMRVGATALYGLLGAAPAAGASFAVLQCKYIQHDTLSGEQHQATIPRIWITAEAMQCSAVPCYTHPFSRSKLLLSSICTASSVAEEGFLL